MTLAAAALVVLLGGQAGPAEAVGPADRAEQAARGVIDRRYQRELPIGRGEREVDKPKDGGKPRSAPGRLRRRAREAEEAQVASPATTAMRLIVYGVLAVALAMIVTWLVRDLRRGGDPDALEGEEVLRPTVDQDVLQRPVGDADELARAGRYADAIHTLLLRTLVELVRATRTRVPASLTSREILERVPLVPAAKAALYALVAAVEVTHFGDEVPGAADYERCRGEFQRFADAYRGAA